ncbi:DNA primase family protein [Phocoenobacter skyensis]|uniref:Putative DNA primase/helicase n=1 Tax=Phocoenobacter skyensis TaxID=97481 RepID=A0A1H7X4U0_9PAST|nr:DUF5906 domain-containing protein [Pasteurella skyensis]SEM28217.1 putative DNA primase/helicase [Pasteurella skyensis]
MAILGKGQEWLFLCEQIRHDSKQKPIILGETQLKEIERLKLSEPNQRNIKIYIFGKLSEAQKTAICLNIATNTEAQIIAFCDNIGQILENVSDYIVRLRTEQNSVAEMVNKSLKKPVMIDLNNDKPTQKQVVESFLLWSKKPLGYDTTKCKMLEYNGLYWEQLSNQSLQRKIMDFYDQFNGDYTANKLKSIADLVALKADEIPTQNSDFIGFKNGVLNKKTGEFLPHHIDHHLRYIENIKCNTYTRTPLFNNWLDFVSNGNTHKKQAILAGLYMILTNKHEWGLFLEATGVAGAGKSVFSQIASIINGHCNTAYISLQELEIDKKRSMLIGKSLAISPDQKPYKGSADELKAITGGDQVTVKINYVDDFSLKLNPVFMLVTNYPLLFTDRNGGISRRRVIIPFDRAIPKDRKDVNFIDKVKTEVYGIVNKLLSLFPDPETAREVLENYKELDEGKNIKREANHLIDFLGHFKLTEDRKGALRVGSARSSVLGANNESLYSAYLFYCQCHNINSLNVLSFKQALPDAFKETGEKTPYSEKMYYGYPTTNAHWKDRHTSIRQWEG